MGYNSDTDKTVTSCWPAFHHDRAAAFQLTEKSLLPRRLSQNDLPGGKTKVLNIHCIRRIILHPDESDDDSAAVSNSDTKDWLNWTEDLDHPNNDEIDGQVDNEDEMDVSNDSDVNNELGVKAALNIPGLIGSARKLIHLKQQPITVALPTINVESRMGTGYRW
jgi:hypothetical protein